MSARKHLRRAAGLLDAGRQGFQPVFAAGGKGDGGTMSGELTGDNQPDAAACPGNQGDGTGQTSGASAHLPTISKPSPVFRRADTRAGRITSPVCETENMDESLASVIVEAAAVLRQAGARFAYLHGSRATGHHRADSDVDIAAYFGGHPPNSFDVLLPPRVDLLVLGQPPPGPDMAQGRQVHVCHRDRGLCGCRTAHLRRGRLGTARGQW
jgi:Polymerase beta, Nucleotidyltransferase